MSVGRDATFVVAIFLCSCSQFNLDMPDAYPGTSDGGTTASGGPGSDGPGVNTGGVPGELWGLMPTVPGDQGRHGNM
jgi:hypothetical protein